MTFDDIRERILAAAELPLARATTLPAAAYTSDAFYAWETAHLLRAGWQCVAHVSQLPRAGDYLDLDLLGDPLIVVRGKDDVVRVLSRVCPHRAMDIHGGRGDKSGGDAASTTRLFLCPYHAWTFELDGRLKACPEMHQAEEFCRPEFGLKPFRVETWQGFVFVNLDGTAPPLAPGLEEMAADVAAFDLAGMQLAVSREWDCAFNWKVLTENFMESYHHLGIHHRTLQPMMPARDTWTERERAHYIRSHLPYRESVRTENPLPGLSAAQAAEWGLFLAHPTFLLATAPDRVIWYRLQPEGPDRLKLLTTVLFSAAAAAQPDFAAERENAEAALVEFHLEDMEVCTAVQRSLRATGWQPGRLSHLEMPVWLIQRYLAARLRGVWPAADRPAAPSQREMSHASAS